MGNFMNPAKMSVNLGHSCMMIRSYEPHSISIFPTPPKKNNINRYFYSHSNTKDWAVHVLWFSNAYIFGIRFIKPTKNTWLREIEKLQHRNLLHGFCSSAFGSVCVGITFHVHISRAHCIREPFSVSSK